MKNNKIVVGSMLAAVAAAVLVMSREPPKKDVPLTIDIIDPVQQQQGPIQGTEIINRQSTPNFETWTRKEWAQYYKDIYLNSSDPQTAGNQVWVAWNVSGNEIKNAFKTKDALVFALATYRNNESITGFDINANSQPVYDTWTNVWWNGIPVWECEQWRTYWDALKAAKGQLLARSIFVDAWVHPDNWSIYGSGQACGIDCDFINYMRQNGIDIALTGAETVCNLISIPANIVSAGASVSKGVKSSADILGQMMPILTITAIAVGSYVVVQNVRRK